jgi:hypothetical protein
MPSAADAVTGLEIEVKLLVESEQVERASVKSPTL